LFSNADSIAALQDWRKPREQAAYEYQSAMAHQEHAGFLARVWKLPEIDCRFWVVARSSWSRPRYQFDRGRK
jgi:hypothetical protein